VSVGKIAAVSLVELTNVVARAAPLAEGFVGLFQFTTELLSKFVPVTVKVRPLGLQYGVDGIDVVEAEMDEITGAGPGMGIIVKRIMFDTSVVVVADVLEVPETEEPGIWIATGTVIGVVPVLVISAAGTTAVNWVLLTYTVFVSWTWFVRPAFHKM
jgi:hypothetical protein